MFGRAAISYRTITPDPQRTLIYFFICFTPIQVLLIKYISISSLMPIA